MKPTIGYAVSFALACSAAIAPASMAQVGPGVPPFESFGRADEHVAACRDAEELFGILLPVGTCLALLRENSTNEVATICAHAQRAGLLPIFPEPGEEGEPILTVADCIEALEDL